MIRIHKMSTLDERIAIWRAYCETNEKGCWLWVGYLNSRGYIERDYNGKRWSMQRLIWTHFYGPIPDGLVVDHLCRIPRCWNPEHLEPVTIKVNTNRGINWERSKTHCPKGHPYDDVNTFVEKGGWRKCRVCISVRTRKHYAKNKALYSARSKQQYQARKARGYYKKENQ